MGFEELMIDNLAHPDTSASRPTRKSLPGLELGEKIGQAVSSELHLISLRQLLDNTVRENRNRIGTDPVMKEIWDLAMGIVDLEDDPDLIEPVHTNLTEYAAEGFTRLNSVGVGGGVVGGHAGLDTDFDVIGFGPHSGIGDLVIKKYQALIVNRGCRADTEFIKTEFHNGKLEPARSIRNLGTLSTIAGSLVILGRHSWIKDQVLATLIPSDKLPELAIYDCRDSKASDANFSRDPNDFKYLPGGSITIGNIIRIGAAYVYDWGLFTQPPREAVNRLVEAKFITKSQAKSVLLAMSDYSIARSAEVIKTSRSTIFGDPQEILVAYTPKDLADPNSRQKIITDDRRIISGVFESARNTYLHSLGFPPGWVEKFVSSNQSEQKSMIFKENGPSLNLKALLAIGLNSSIHTLETVSDIVGREWQFGVRVAKFVPQLHERETHRRLLDEVYQTNQDVWGNEKYLARLIAKNLELNYPDLGRP